MEFVPILRFEIDGIKNKIIHNFALHSKEVNKTVAEAVERLCTPENLEALINKTVQDNIDKIMREEIIKFFSYGDGRKVISDSVKALLNKDNHSKE